MADRIVQLQDKDGNNVYPISTIQDSDSAKITMTDTDPGEGVPLAANNYIAVYGSAGSLLDMFYPVGSYYETSDTSFDPNVSWGGAWVEDSAGKVTVSYDTGTFSTVGSTGGRESTNHVFWRPPVNSGKFQDPGSHYLDNIIPRVNSWLQQGGSSNLTTNTSVTGAGGDVRSDGTNNTEAAYFRYTSTNLQPYVVVKRWHRIA